MTGERKMSGHVAGGEIQRGNGVAAWRQIETVLRGEIAGGLYRSGEQLPTEPQLAERFGVNRHTVRRALLVLAQAGLLSIEQGRGTFVRDQVIDYPIGKRTRFSEIIAGQQHEPSGSLIDSDILAASKEIAERLEIETAGVVIRLDILNLSDEIPISFSSNWFPARRFPDMIEAYRSTGSISAALSLYGLENYKRAWTTLVARMPSRRDADILRQAPNRPILMAESVNSDEEGKAIQYSQTRFAGDRVQVRLEP